MSIREGVGKRRRIPAHPRSAWRHSGGESPRHRGNVASGASLRWEPRYVEGGAPPIRCARSRPPPESSLWSEQDAVNDAVLLPDRRPHSGLRGSAPAGFPHWAPATAGAASLLPSAVAAAGGSPAEAGNPRPAAAEYPS